VKKDRAARPRRPPSNKMPASQTSSSPQPSKVSQPAQRNVTSNRQSAKPVIKQPAKPVIKKPAKPITQKMVQGKEPMRTFSDLVQYYEVKQQGDANETPDK
jgi:hypothetical protein